jgi:uncharacterized protein YqiB (DUF1249 family)
MIGDDLCAISWRARPGSFVGLMTLYESNYIRLGWLAGDLRALAGEHRSSVAQDCELRLTVLERGRYTTMLALTYAIADGAGLPDAPDLTVRVYHDARLAEAHGVGAAVQGPVATAAPAAQRPAARREPGLPALGARWARNMLLNKWLEYCVDRGHRFGVAGA